MSCLAIIPARGGSKLLQHKNRQLIGNETLVQRTCRYAESCPEISEWLVSTDCDNILNDVNSLWSKHVIKRPPELAEDHVHASLVVKNVVEQYTHANKSYDHIAMLLPTIPFRESGLMKRALKLLDEADSVVALKKIDVWAHQLRKIDDNGYVSPMLKEFSHNAQRQDAPQVCFSSGAVFVATWNSFLQHGTFHQERTKAIFVKGPYTLDINSSEELDIANQLLKEMS